MFEFDDENGDLNSLKTEIIINLYNYMSFYESNLDVFRDMIYEILNTETEDELIFLEMDLADNDIMLENIFKKHKINRQVINEAHQ